jgi:hypothetical protein
MTRGAEGGCKKSLAEGETEEVDACARSRKPKDHERRPIVSQVGRDASKSFIAGEPSGTLVRVSLPFDGGGVGWWR